MLKMKALMALPLILNMAGSCHGEGSYPAPVENFINDLKKGCEGGKLDVSNTIHLHQPSNHSTQYYVFTSKNLKCSTIPSFMNGSGGYLLVVFVQVNNRWVEGLHHMVVSHRFLPTSDKNKPAPIEVEQKDGPKVKKVTYEWNARADHYQPAHTMIGR